jgi:hypothetical protein
MAMMMEAEAAKTFEAEISFVVENGRPTGAPYPSSEVTCNILLTCNGTQNYSQAVSVLLGHAAIALIDMGSPVEIDGGYPLTFQVSNIEIDGSPAEWGLSVIEYAGVDAAPALITYPPGGNSATFTIPVTAIPNTGSFIRVGITIHSDKKHML